MEARVRAAFRGQSAGTLSHEATAAVLIALTVPGEEILMIKRAAHLNSHPGEMAFPGGRRDPDDANLIVTALREAEEEIGLVPSSVEVLGVMSPNSSRFGVPVQPVIGIVPAGVDLRPNLAELDTIHRIPLRFFCDTTPALLHEVKYQGRTFLMPGYRWHDEVVWGLSARFLVSFIECVFDRQIEWPEPRVAD